MRCGMARGNGRWEWQVGKTAEEQVTKLDARALPCAHKRVNCEARANVEGIMTEARSAGRTGQRQRNQS
jgi:hypothetical protein